MSTIIKICGVATEPEYYAELAHITGRLVYILNIQIPELYQLTDTFGQQYTLLEKLKFLYAYYMEYGELPAKRLR